MILFGFWFEFCCCPCWFHLLHQILQCVHIGEDFGHDLSVWVLIPVCTVMEQNKSDEISVAHYSRLFATTGIRKRKWHASVNMQFAWNKVTQNNVGFFCRKALLSWFLFLFSVWVLFLIEKKRRVPDGTTKLVSSSSAYKAVVSERSRMFV